MTLKIRYLAMAMVMCIASCKKKEYVFTYKGSCSDGLLNQDETSIDCGGICGLACSDTGLAHTQKYYVSFLYDGNPVVFEADEDFLSANPFQSIEGIGRVATSQGLSGPHATFSIRLPSFSKSTDDYLDLNHDTLYFESPDANGGVAHFSFVNLNGYSGSTENVSASSPSASNQVIIDDVVFDNGKTPYDTYKMLVTGRFAGKVSASSGGPVHTISQGTFGIAFSASN